MLTVLLAQTEYKIGDLFQGGWLQGIGRLGEIVEPGGYPTRFNFFDLFFKIISAIVGIMTIVAAIWFVFQFFIGAIQILASSGDKTKMQEASAKITYAVIGIVIVIGAIFFISLVGSLTGLKILGPWEFITDLWS